MLPVFFEDTVVGQLNEAAQGLSFTYDSEWLRREGSFSISLTMPLRDEAYGPDVATAWFANLLPEDRQLEQIGRLLGRSQSDVYGLLEQIGRETAGALSIGGPEAIEDADYRELNEEGLSATIQRLPQRPLLAGDDMVTMSLAGAQTKLAVAVFDDKISLPLHGAASTHILKPESERLYATVENELLCMRLAEKLGLPVARTVMGIAGRYKFLLIERYDRNIISRGRVRREHQEDLCQALGFYPTEKYEARRGPGFKDLFATIDSHARRSARDRLSLLALTIFACCIGDTDRHGKNFSLILTGGGPRLSPGYDFLSALPYEGITRNLAMKIAGKNRAEYLERRHWERFARDVRLSPAATVQEVARIGTAAASHVEKLASELAEEFPAADTTALQSFAAGIQQQAAQVASNSQKDTSIEPAEAD